MEEEEQISPRQTSASMHGANAIESLESIQNGLETLDGRADPDAQATVTDFLEFTEHLPADMTRSLTLIGKLDRDHADASATLHELTRLWGQLPSLPTNEHQPRPQPAQLRADIADSVLRTYDARLLSHAEAVRMAENVNRHVNRLKLIHAKLRNMLENYPADDGPRSPLVTARSPQATRGTNKRQPAGGDKGRRPRGPRITVPGEVLAPYEVGYDTYSDVSESSSEEEEEEDEEPVVVTHRRTQATPRGGGQRPRGERKAAVEKTPKAPKPRAPRSAAHANAGGEASQAPPAAVLKPPPEDAELGSEHKPWLQLTEYELARLRKRMKKNASWIPSDTMINRELKTLGRGYDGWSSAKKQAEEEGLPFETSLPQPIVDDATGSEHLPMGAVSLDSAIAAEDKTLTNRGHELNKAKKIKKDRLSDQAAKEAEESTKRFMLLARNFQVSFQPPQPSSQPQAKNTKRQQKKRKRDSVSEVDAEKPDPAGLKRSKTETPVPIPQHINLPRQTPIPPPQVTPGGTHGLLSTTPVPIPIPGHDQSIMVGAKSSAGTSPAPSVEPGTTTTSVPTKAPADDLAISPKTSTTPILPPVRETRAREAKGKESTTVPPPIKTTGSRGNTPGVVTPGTEASSRRPSSRGQGMTQDQQQPGLAAERPRRASTARNTPAPELSLRQPSRRTKRPAPGIISRTNSGGNSAITKRKAAPRKSKRGSAGSQKKDRGQTADAEAEVEVDEEGNVIDPNEERYCFCNRVSFGTMVMCENDSVGQVCAFVYDLLYGLTDDGDSASTSGSTSSALGSIVPQCCLRFGTAKTAGPRRCWTRRARVARGH